MYVCVHMCVDEKKNWSFKTQFFGLELNFENHFLPIQNNSTTHRINGNVYVIFYTLTSVHAFLPTFFYCDTTKNIILSPRAKKNIAKMQYMINFNRIFFTLPFKFVSKAIPIFSIERK